MTFFADFTSGQSNVSYTRMRQLLATSGGGLQEGVIGAGDLKVGQRAAGANMSVDVAVGDAWVQYDTGTRNGLSHVWSDAIANVAFNASDATNPRIDQIGVQLNDVAVGAGTGGNTPAPRYLPGTATAGATLDNRTGAAAAPNDWLRLADILVPAASTSVVTANIRDRRPWARGAYNRIVRTTNAAAGSDYTTALTTLALIDATNLQPRIECSGAALRMWLRGVVIDGANLTPTFQPWMDGAIVEAGAQFHLSANGTTGETGPFAISYDFIPPPGSHLLGWAWANSTATTLTLRANATSYAQMGVEEIVRPNASNT